MSGGSGRSEKERILTGSALAGLTAIVLSAFLL